MIDIKRENFDVAFPYGLPFALKINTLALKSANRCRYRHQWVTSRSANTFGRRNPAKSPLPPRPLHRVERTALIGDRKPLRPARAAALAPGLRGRMLHRHVGPVDFGHPHASRVPAGAFQPDRMRGDGGEFCHGWEVHHTKYLPS